MQQSQLIQLLASLSVNELRLFDKFVHSSYFNSHADTIRLFEILKPHYPDFLPESIEKEKVFAALFPDQPYKDELLRTLRKYLVRQLSYFLAVQRFQEDELMLQYYMLDILGEKEVHTYYRKQFRHAANQIKKYPGKDGKFFLKQFLVERSWLEYQFRHEKREDSPDLLRAHELLDHYYLFTKLELIASELSRTVVLGGEYKESLFSKEIMEYMDQAYQEYPPLIQAYYFAAKLLKTSEEKAEIFSQLKQLLRESGATFSTEDHTQLYLYLIGYTNQRYREGKAEFLGEMFQIYQAMLENDLMFDGKIIPVHNYKNLVTLGLRLGHYDWTEKFIHTYKEFIPHQYQEGIYHYNLAHLYFYQKKYGEALLLLHDVEFLDTFYQLGFKMLQLKIYYEQLEVESFLGLAKTFQTHIRRQTGIPDDRKDAYYNFVAILRKLFRIKIAEKNNLEEVADELANKQPIIEKGWLVEKVEEFPTSPKK